MMINSFEYGKGLTDRNTLTHVEHKKLEKMVA